MTDPRSIEVFYWVVMLGSFRGAAEKLHTTQPAVSGRIAQLEAGFNARLIERERGRKVVPTAKGVELLGFAERMLALQADLTRAMSAADQLSGTIRLGTAETIVHTWLGALVKRVHADHPALMLDVSVDISVRLLDQLQAGAIDLALLLGPIVAPRIRNVTLCSYELAWVAAPGLVTPDTSLADLLGHPLITYPRETSPYREVLDLLHASGQRSPRLLANSSLASMVRMVKDGIGIGVIARAAIQDEIDAGALQLLHGPVLSPLVFTASYLGDPSANRAAAVADMAQAVAAASSNAAHG